MHGITKEIALPFKITKRDGNTLGYEIHTKINRLDFQVGHGFVHSVIDHFLADEVEVDIYFWTKRKKIE